MKKNTANREVPSRFTCHREGNILLWSVVSWLLVGFSIASGQQIWVSGQQKSTIQYRMEQEITTSEGIKELVVSFVVPSDFSSFTYRQRIHDLKFNFSPQPTHREEKTDKRGNNVQIYYWESPATQIRAIVSFQASTQVNLNPITPGSAHFPLKEIPEDVRDYLLPTEQVQSNHPAIQEKAQELTSDVTTLHAATMRILTWVAQHMHYVLVPEQYDALYAFNTGKGNCQNYSHLAAALLRAVGIPARIVNGITLNKPYDIPLGESAYQFKMAQGRHSWIEVYFPEEGWLPFDPQQTEFFVSNRYLRIEVGVDNNETVQDGLVRWRQSHGSEPQTPKLEEAFISEFLNDEVAFQGKLGDASIEKLLLSPPIQEKLPLAAAIPPKPDEEEQPPEKSAEETPPETEEMPEEVDYTTLNYEEPFLYGNLDFPENVNFAFPRETSQLTKNKLTRTFLVETAEYVTGNHQYAQVFILEEPIRLEFIGLALHNFGGSGRLWLELCEDNNGHPGPPAVRSKPVHLSELHSGQGYRWVDFDFRKEGIILSPGKYWFFLNFDGGPIVNWFYSYGKPVGPSDGTRSRKLGEREWNTILSYEFNYRVVGKASK
ncbi:MAG: hypothetical protein D6748_12055 [Calditrichaeota bacterium]|nr:MAG: hypothetical protein D6748_12055 [Calditrichota bacterium]